jgi:predicted DNA-binding transcriptional regulator YafY
MKMSQQQVLLPGDRVKFTYRDKKGVVSNRDLKVENVAEKDGKTLIGGYDLSVGPKAYRQFSLNNMSNLAFSLPETAKVAETPAPTAVPAQEVKNQPSFTVVYVYQKPDDLLLDVLAYLLGY